MSDTYKVIMSKDLKELQRLVNLEITEHEYICQGGISSTMVFSQGNTSSTYAYIVEYAQAMVKRISQSE